MINRRRALAAGHEPSQADGIPDTLAAVGAVGEQVGTAGFPIGYLGVTWMGVREGAVARFRVGDGWTGWRPLPLSDRPGCGRHGVLVPAGGAAGYEVRLPLGACAPRTVAINTTHGPRARREVAAGDGLAVPAGNAPYIVVGGVRFLSRVGWEADASQRFGPDGTELFPPAYVPVQTLTVHHTVTANNDPDPAATVRAIYYFQTITEDFGDVGYHLLIDQNGTIYEGRWSGPDPIPAFEGGRPTGLHSAHEHRRPRWRVQRGLRGNRPTRRPHQHPTHPGRPAIPRHRARRPDEASAGWTRSVGWPT